MTSRQTTAQKKTVSRVMHEYRHGELKIRGNGPKVKSSKQALAIALHEAGATNQESDDKNKQNLRRTKRKEHKGETAQASKEGKGAQDRTMAKSDQRRIGRVTKGDLYAEAKQQDVPGRSKMSKKELQRALHR